jgi:glycosyltransferase involved in cell wall biosynthesis
VRILFFSDHFYPEPSAPAAHVYERAKLWVQQGHDVTVICSAPNFPEGKVQDGYRNAWRKVEFLAGIRVVRVKTYISRNEGTVRRTLDYLSYMVSSLVFSLFERRPEVIMSTSPHLFVPLAATLAAKLRRRPHVFEVRDLWPASIAATDAMRGARVLRWLERLELWLYAQASRVLVLTPSFRRDLMRRGVAEQKIDVVITGANLDLFRPAERRDAEITELFGLRDRFVIGYLGTLGLAHGLDNVLDTAMRLRDLPITFLFVGVGAAKEGLERRVREQGLDNVVFAPRQAKEDMPRFWSVCDASLVHLKADPVFGSVIPSKIFESMAVGLPILYVAPEGDGSEIVRRHEAGLTVEPMQPAAFESAVRRLFADRDLYTRLRAQSRAAASQYSRRRQADASLAVLQRAVTESSGEAACES